MTYDDAEGDGRRAHHDMGGVSRYACREIDTEPHALTAFDKRVDALRQLLSAKELMTVDELRRGIEEIPEAEYLRLSYYQTLLRKGVILPGELDAALARARA